MKKFWFGVLLFSFSLICARDENKLFCEQALQHFIAVDEQNYLNYDVMHTIFSSVDLDAKELMAAIRNDIIRCKRYIRRHPHDDCAQHKLLLQQLRSFFNYTRKHKHCCSAIQFHNDVRQRYALTFNNPKIVQSINATPHLYGIPYKCKNKCKTYFNQVLIDLAKIDKFEDYLHGDYSTLKAHNYVFKIELVKVRNSIYHNNVYKYETSYF